MYNKSNNNNMLYNSEISEFGDEKFRSSEKELRNFAGRLKIILGNQSVRSFASACDLSDGVIRQYLSGKSEPGLEALIKIARFANVGVSWLATGEGPMRREEASGLNLDVPAPVHFADAAEMLDEYALVPYYDVNVSAGGGAYVESEQIVDHLAFKKKWVHSMNLTPSNLLLVNVIGDSMVPKFVEGDLLLVDRGQRKVKDDAIFVLRFDGTLIAKRLQMLYDGSIRIKSDNQVYDAQVVPPDRVHVLNIIGRVVWSGGRV